MSILREAAKNLPGHWCKGSFSGPYGTRCAMGHMIDVRTESSEYTLSDMAESMRILAGVVQEFSNNRYIDIVAFNDAKETSEADVIAVLEKAAVRQDEKAGLE